LQAGTDQLLLPIHDNALVTDFLGKGALNLPHYKEDAPAVVALQMGSSEFDETYHWHTGQPLEEAYWQEASKDQAPIHVRFVSLLSWKLLVGARGSAPGGVSECQWLSILGTGVR
jgi:hypothetical protein